MERRWWSVAASAQRHGVGLWSEVRRWHMPRFAGHVGMMINPWGNCVPAPGAGLGALHIGQPPASAAAEARECQNEAAVFG